MTWRKARFGLFRNNSGQDCVASTFPRLVRQRFPFPGGPVLENLALRRQLLALHAQQPRRRFTALHKLFWVALRTCWSGWTKPLLLVTPRTVAMSPPGYPSAWLRPRSARFRFTWQNHYNSATSCRFSTSGLPVTPPELRPARPES